MKPEYLSQGEQARLFPVLSTTSKEGRTTSIFLACLAATPEFAGSLLQGLGGRIGKRSIVRCYTEICFDKKKPEQTDRPDGLIEITTAKNTWRALIEAKVGSSQIVPDQIERYRQLARDNDCQCVITISNQFATRPEHHPDQEVRKSRSKTPVFHWSWMHILTQCDLLIGNDALEDEEQRLLMLELRKFLTHESAGVKGFERMPPEWTALNKLVSNGGKIPAKSAEADAVIDAWHQETRDLSLILSRQTETNVRERLSRRHASHPTERRKDEIRSLKDECRLACEIDIDDAASPIWISADLQRRTIEVGMRIPAPQDRVSSKARLNWLLKQIKDDFGDRLQIRCNWPGRSEATQFDHGQLIQDPALIEEGKSGLTVWRFDVFFSQRLGPKFTQQTNFISELEQIVPEFYRLVGQNLTLWQKKPPKIKQDKADAEDVSVEAMDHQSIDDEQP